VEWRQGGSEGDRAIRRERRRNNDIFENSGVVYNRRQKIGGGASSAPPLRQRGKKIQVKNMKNSNQRGKKMDVPVDKVRKNYLDTTSLGNGEE